MADITVGIIVGEGLVTLIPVWFYLFSSLAYCAAAVISALISYFSWKIYRKKRMKSNLLLSLGFAGLAVSFAILTFTSLFTYLYIPYLRGFLSLNRVNVNGFNLYYIISVISYILLNLVYLPKKFVQKIKIFPVLFVPIYYMSSSAFHIVSIILVAIIAARTIFNFARSKSLNASLVMICFLAMVTHHILIYNLPFDIAFYLLAHVVLAAGFLSLLTMLIRVNMYGRKKK
jgi:hypothetical protein